MIRFDCSQICCQKQELRLVLKLVLEVRCLIAYIRGRQTRIPIKPEISTRKAKLTGYQYTRADMHNLGEDFMWLEVFGMPEDLKEVCYIQKVSE